MTTKTVSVSLVGATPLMFNKQSEKPLSRDLDAKKVAESKMHRDAKGRPCIPKLLLMRSLIGAGRYVTYHKMRNFTSGKEPNLSTIVTSCIDIREDLCLISPGKWEIDQQPFNAHNGDKVSRPTEGAIRPRFPSGWRVSFTLDYDTSDEHITEEKIRKLVETAGKKIGLGSYRVENTGWYGKFIVAEWRRKK